jgi:elongation factor 3
MYLQTANEYIRWRYGNGEDKENIVKVSMEVNDAEKALQKEAFEVIWKDDDGKVQKANRVIMELVGSRRENKQVKEYEYEVKYRDGAEGYLTLKTLTKRGWKKAADAIDARIAQRSGQYTRTLSSGTKQYPESNANHATPISYSSDNSIPFSSTANVEKHLADCGLDPEFATHYRMGALSGGQKVKGESPSAYLLQVIIFLQYLMQPL